MEVKEQEKLIHKIGKVLANSLKGFYGKIVFNFSNGVYQNANVEQSIKPEKQEKKE